MDWTCHICKELRPDDKISVFSKPFLILKGQIIGSQNIRYCNDKESCKNVAKDFSFFPTRQRGLKMSKAIKCTRCGEFAEADRSGILKGESIGLDDEINLYDLCPTCCILFKAWITKN